MVNFMSVCLKLMYLQKLAMTANIYSQTSIGKILNLFGQINIDETHNPTIKLWICIERTR
ncbi:unnamed protein product [Paramecium sonneborni]|uniref:Uncharacterized protein n=1 Tax=Paramecium sonneborni TaxID=65129 RepID=A0A8S1LHG8_9CILI|nr:unnamed protein product [Paramecium sonneborni]